MQESQSTVNALSVKKWLPANFQAPGFVMIVELNSKLCRMIMVFKFLRASGNVTVHAEDA